MKDQPDPGSTYVLKVRVQEFKIPPIHDGLVLGKHSPIGCVAIRKAIELLGNPNLSHLEIEDDVISDIIVRRAVLRRIPQESLIAFVVQRIKPLMGPEEVLHLDLEVEILLEERPR